MVLSSKYFSISRSVKSGLAASCKICDARAQAVRRGQPYDISTEDYWKLYEAQKGLCAICSNEDRLAIDHCHKTGRVRGLLCMGCNTGLGKLKDDPKILKEAIVYLETATIVERSYTCDQEEL